MIQITGWITRSCVHVGGMQASGRLASPRGHVTGLSYHAVHALYEDDQ
jgi:hypothetical protein